MKVLDAESIKHYGISSVSSSRLWMDYENHRSHDTGAFDCCESHGQVKNRAETKPVEDLRLHSANA